MKWKTRKATQRVLKIERWMTEVQQKAIRVLQTWTTDLNKQLQRVSSRWLKISTVLVVLVGFITAYRISNSITGRKEKVTLGIEPIKIIQHKGTQQNASPSLLHPISKHDYEKLIFYQTYMDSLLVHHPRLHDSLWRLHPALMDTVKLLRKIYEEAHK